MPTSSCGCAFAALRLFSRATVDFAGQDRRRAAGLFDLFLGRGTEPVGRDRQLLGQLAVAQHLQHVVTALQQIPFSCSTSGVIFVARFEQLFQIADVDPATVRAKTFVKPRLGMRRTSGLTTALEDWERLHSRRGRFAPCGRGPRFCPGPSRCRGQPLRLLVGFDVLDGLRASSCTA